MKQKRTDTLVYSSETGRIRENHNKIISQTTKEPSDGAVRLRREVKGRGGGTVIVISGISLTGEQLKELAGRLKKRCGSGGTVKNGIIEIQGDHRELLTKELQTAGYRVKMSGG